MNNFKLCERCGSLVSFNIYFGAYICKNKECRYRDDKFNKERIKKYSGKPYSYKGIE